MALGWTCLVDTAVRANYSAHEDIGELRMGILEVCCGSRNVPQERPHRGGVR